MSVKDHIEDIALAMIRSVALQKSLRLAIPDVSKKENEKRTKMMTFRSSKKRFATLFRVLSSIYELQCENSFMTKRDLYYADPSYFGKQNAVDRAIDDACAVLQCSRWKVNIMNTSRALLFGDLLCEDMSSKSVVDFKSNSQGTCLSMEPSRLKILSCGAKFVMIVEKDATFQTILDSNFFALFAPCLIVTGKGYPDCNLRQLLSNLQKVRPDLQMFALMDPDPYGLLIYHVYKYNSKNMRRIEASDEIPKLPSLILIGVLSSELKSLHLRSEEMIPLTKRDFTVLNNIQSSPVFGADKQTHIEVKSFLESGTKAEIQTLRLLGRNFLCDVYLRTKLSNHGIFPRESRPSQF